MQALLQVKYFAKGHAYGTPFVTTIKVANQSTSGLNTNVCQHLTSTSQCNVALRRCLSLTSTSQLNIDVSV